MILVTAARQKCFRSTDGRLPSAIHEIPLCTTRHSNLASVCLREKEYHEKQCREKNTNPIILSSTDSGVNKIARRIFFFLRALRSPSSKSMKFNACLRFLFYKRRIVSYAYLFLSTFDIFFLYTHVTINYVTCLLTYLLHVSMFAPLTFFKEDTRNYFYFSQFYFFKA